MGFTAAGISPSTVTTTQQAPLGFELTVPDGDNGLQEWVYVFNDEASTLKIMNGEILGNQSLADSGGGISNSGTLEVTISTIRGNQAMQSGTA